MVAPDECGVPTAAKTNRETIIVNWSRLQLMRLSRTLSEKRVRNERRADG